MSPALHKLWTERGWVVGTSVDPRDEDAPGPVWTAWAIVPPSGAPDDGGDRVEGYGPTEAEAVAALLAKLEPPPLPRLAPTLRGEVRVLLDWVCARRAHWEDDLGRITAATPAQREAWLAAFPDEPAGAAEVLRDRPRDSLPWSCDECGRPGWKAVGPEGHCALHWVEVYEALFRKAERERDEAREDAARWRRIADIAHAEDKKHRGGALRMADDDMEQAISSALRSFALVVRERDEARAARSTAGGGWVRDATPHEPLCCVGVGDEVHTIHKGGWALRLPPLPKETP